MKISRWLLLLLCSSINLSALDLPEFYRASYLASEPRFATPGLTSIDLFCAGGLTHQGLNSHGQTVPLFDIIGHQAMRPLGLNVSSLDPDNPLDAMILNLAAEPARPLFAELKIAGSFSIIETILLVTQNLINGFFLQAYFPIKHLAVRNMTATDLSPNDMIEPNKNTPAWQTFLNNFNAIMAEQGLKVFRTDPASGNDILSLNNNAKSGVGDLFLLGGWTWNYQQTQWLDFIDVTGKVGIIVPTSKGKSLLKPFSIPLGYNGHIGIPLVFDAAIGALNWLTIGIHLDGLFFLDKTRTVRIQTNPQQNGFIKLAYVQAKVDQGTIWDVGTYIKADHWLRGLSCTIGYRYTKQDASFLELKNEQFDSQVTSRDNEFKAWRMHTLNLCAEYDCARTTADLGPRIGLISNIVLGGARVFKTPMFGGYLGIDIQWNF